MQKQKTGYTQKKLLSIIIPFYNVKPYVQCLIDSILPQVNEEVEIIVVEDGSTDGTRELIRFICEDLKPEMDIVSIFHNKNKGLSEARNSGLKYAKGKYVMFLDSDDLLKEEAINNIINQITKTEADMIVYTFVEFEDTMYCPYMTKDISVNYPSQKRLEKYVCSKVETQNKSGFFLDYLNNKKYYACMYVAKRELYLREQLKFPKNRYYEDMYTSPILVWSAKTICYLNIPIFYYRQRSAGIRGTINKQSRMDLYSAFDDLIVYFKKKDVPSDIISALYYNSIYYKRMAFWDLYKTNPTIDKGFFREDIKKQRQKIGKSFFGYIAASKDHNGLYPALLDSLFLYCVNCFIIFQKIKGKILLIFCKSRKLEKRCDYYQDEYGNIV